MRYPSRRSSMLMLLLASSAWAQQDETRFELLVGSDRSEALYELGEQAQFTIQVTDAGTPGAWCPRRIHHRRLHQGPGGTKVAGCGPRRVSDLPRSKSSRVCLYPKTSTRSGRSRCQKLATRYHRQFCHTRRARRQYLSVGFAVGVYPPSSVYTAYNALAGDKQILNEPLMGHAAPEHITDAFWAALKAHVARPAVTDQINFPGVPAIRRATHHRRRGRRTWSRYRHRSARRSHPLRTDRARRSRHDKPV